MFPGYSGEPDDVLNPKKKVWEMVQPDLHTNTQLVACYKDVPFTTTAGVCNVSSISSGVIRKWTRIRHAGDPPSPRAAHAAAAVGSMVVFQGAIGPAGHSTDDLYVLDLTNDIFKWHRVVVQGPGPGLRYGHAMDLVSQRYLVTVSGNDVTTTGFSIGHGWAHICNNVTQARLMNAFRNVGLLGTV